MSKLFLLAGLLAAAPAYVLAQSTTPAPSSTTAPYAHPRANPQFRDQFRQMMQQQETMHKQVRAKVLGALTPAHRTLLASLVGQLAIATNPDPQAAIKKFDAALSSGEKSAIQNVLQSFMTQQRALRQQMMQRMRAANPNMKPPRPMPSRPPRAMRMPDPGAIVFMLATGFEPRMRMGMHGPFMGRGMPRGMRPPGAPGGFMRRPKPGPTATP